MDEAQLVKEHKLEWVSICLMNKALQFAQGDEEAVQDFSVQSERDIWWLVAFGTPKECHETLKWSFQRVGITEIIKRQEEGQTVVVDGLGTFQVEWHLASDLKTWKCLFGCDT